MGYCTDYYISIIHGDSSLLGTDDFKVYFSNVTGGYDVENLYAIKWYEHDEDMRQISKAYPNYVFKLEGNGEDRDDTWIHYYCNGVCQDANLRYISDPFDPTTGQFAQRCPELLL